jgi:tetratricopeptide (TPR) repeat protein
VGLAAQKFASRRSGVSACQKVGTLAAIAAAMIVCEAGRPIGLRELAVAPLFAQGQPVGTMPVAAAAVEPRARELFELGDYDKAVPILERAHETEPANLRLFSLLGMAYLYSASHVDLYANVEKARRTMEDVVTAGGDAVFRVGRANDPLKSQIKFVLKAIQGELRISRDALAFTPDRGSGDGAVTIAKGDIRECGPNKGYGKDSNTFHFKTVKDTINFRPLHFSKEEARLACDLAAQFLGVKVVN